MTPRTDPLDPIREWGYLHIGDTPGANQVTEREAKALLDAAAAHPLAKDDGANILVQVRRSRLRAQQMVGVLAAEGCSLEILPKIDPDLPDGVASFSELRKQLVNMLDVAYDLDIGMGAEARMERGAESLLEVLIRSFAQDLLQEARRGLPRGYVRQEEDLPRLRGRLDVLRQFTHHAVRPDRLACRFEEMTSDIPLMQIMKATVRFLDLHARSALTRRLLAELRFILADISEVQPTRQLWQQVLIDRTNRRWQRLKNLAGMLLRRDWQLTSSTTKHHDGISLLFPMNDLFELYVENMLRRTLAGTGIEVVGQGGNRYCLGDWTDEGVPVSGNVFRTRPDIILKQGNDIVGIIDTKWKRLSRDVLDRKKGVQQADVYQLMAYARIYWPPLKYLDSKVNPRLMLLYPAIPGSNVEGIQHRFGISTGRELLALGQIDVSRPRKKVGNDLKELVIELLGGIAGAV